MAWKYLLEFLKVFVRGLGGIFYNGGSNGSKGGIFGGIAEMFNFEEYGIVFDAFKLEDPSTGDWIIMIGGVALAVLLVLALITLIIILIVKFFRRLFSKETNQDLIGEIARLRAELKRSEKNRDRLFQLKVQGKEGTLSSYALEDDIAIANAAAIANKNNVGNSSSLEQTGGSRFYKLIEIDEKYKEYEAPEFDNEITLEQICDNFRNYACSQLKLFYEPRVIRLFFAAFATTRIIILQGISGTGKTSLPYAVGKWLGNPATIASVQPSWRDRTEIFGYFNEFTKRFNETEILKKMYEARYSDEMFLTIIDEANIARVEYYFAELLSILEMPSRENWVVDITPSGWDSDPKFIERGRFKLPENMWYICTINNDDSTFAISDKVYDRAIPININSKGFPFEVENPELYHDNMKISYKHLEAMFKDAQEKYVVSQENIKKFDDMDNYVIEHFRLAFGNRIVKQLKEFVPVYVACGGTEIDGLDYVLCNKILRKFESLNLAYIRDEIDGYIDYLDEHFGVENMTESKDYLRRLKKLF